MHFLEALDTQLFRCINQSLANPVFDRLMPWLSGNVVFFPLLAVLAVGLVLRYRRTGALCLVMLAVILPLGDTFVITTIKRAVQRPRPFVAVAGTKQLDRASPYASMPSAHAANWFCATMIAALYFRRSTRILLPLALAVSYSRVYNGVHYPGDVLAGAVLGAGYGFVGVYSLQHVWRWVGRKWFPLWYQQLPALVPVRDGAPTLTPASPTKELSDTQWLRAGYVLIVLLTLGRWIYLASGTVELSEDEAYQWHWSKHLALSYYSKPPMIAYAQWLGTHLWGDTTFGVRFLSPLIAAGLGLMLLRFFTREIDGRVGFFTVLILNATPLLAIGAMLMTVDPLSVLFWTAAMLAGWKAVRPEGGVKDWALVGLWMGLGFLSKYTALFQLVCWVVFFVLWKPARVHLRRPGPGVALAITVTCFLPVIIWNQQHHWITATHVAGNAGLGRGWSAADALDNFGEFLGVEAGLLNPVFYVAMLWALVAFWKRHRTEARYIYFFSMGAPVFLIYLGWTIHSRVLPNWIAPSVLPLFVLTIFYWEDQRRRGARQVVPSLASGVILGMVLIVLMSNTDLLRRMFRAPAPGRDDRWAKLRQEADEKDPTNRVRGWTETAQEVARAREHLLAEGKPVFIIGVHYGITSLVSFYLPEARQAVARAPLVFVKTSDAPQNQFYFWPDYLGRKGENAIYITHPRHHDPVPDEIVAQFESVKPLPVQPVVYRGRVIRELQLYECRNLR